MSNLIMVFDVESIGLYGEGFAVGWVVVDLATGEEKESIYIACPDYRAEGEGSDRDWVLKNVCPHLPDPNALKPDNVRSYFWYCWQKWKNLGATLWADCGYPVEANFLRACVADDPGDRTWHAPYPLHEIASVLAVKGINSLAERDRLPNELPKHHPVCDARQSARILIEALKN